MEENKKKLENSELDAVGGYVFNAGCWAGVREKPYEVIDDRDGSVLGRYSSKDEAIKMAEKKCQTTKGIRSWSELYSLREVLDK